MTELVRRRGQVVDQDGLPVPHAYVVVADGPEPMPEIALQADETGRFAIGLPAGRWTLRAHGDAGTGTADVVGAPDAADVVIAIG